MRHCILVVLMIISPLGMYAQEELEINYFAHNAYTDEFVSKMNDLFSVRSYNSDMISYFYLADSAEPTVFKCTGSSQKDYEQFEAVFLSKTSRGIWPEVDIVRLIQLLEAEDFLDDSGRKKYAYFTLNFFVTPEFFEYGGYQDSLIGRLIWDLALLGNTESGMLQGCNINVYQFGEGIYRQGDVVKFDDWQLNDKYQVAIY